MPHGSTLHLAGRKSGERQEGGEIGTGHGGLCLASVKGWIDFSLKHLMHLMIQLIHLCACGVHGVGDRDRGPEGSSQGEAAGVGSRGWKVGEAGLKQQELGSM